MVKIYITQWALSSGILEREAELIESREFYKADGFTLFDAKHCFLTLEDAQRDVVKKANKKIEANIKSTLKLQKLIQKYSDNS